jgi:hypothetical protein
MRTTIVILTLLFCSCSTDKKPDKNNVVGQTDIVTLSDTTTKSTAQHSEPIPLTIFPGQGINNIKLGTSNYEDILDFNITFAVDSGEGIACGDDFSCHNFWKRYSNEESGLLIEYSSECFPEPNIPKTYTRELCKINIQDNKFASLKNGLRIGTSTYSDVAKIYGPIPKEWKNESYLRFEKKGISFRFDGYSKLSEVEIFKPDK